MTIEDIELQDEWLSETAEHIKNGGWWYKFFCFMMGRRKRKLNYREIFLLIYGLNKNKLGEEEAKRVALYKILEIYHHNHGKLPDGVKLTKNKKTTDD